ncbi:MAG TPA: NTP transferase domain-containing protein [Candidatus Cybelea sp.]|jgi:CTP:molybdopterin cytidylyltransferase MocA|nr:NTP transferase domain-containing protein [Candidatus Cybelea sp.]
MKAVITAGGRIDGAFAEAAGTTVKALAPVRGTTMLERMIGALRAAGVSEIAVVGGNEVRAECGSTIERFVQESESGSENLLRALRAWPEDERLIYATSDLPYVTAAAIGDFVKRVGQGTLAVALSEYADFTARFPGAPPFGITLARERVVNGGLFSIPQGAGEKLAAMATRFFEARKRPWRMASLVGPAVLIRFLSGRLRVADLETMALHVLQVPAQALRGCSPELAFDVDTIDEYTYVCAHE